MEICLFERDDLFRQILDNLSMVRTEGYKDEWQCGCAFGLMYFYKSIWEKENYPKRLHYPSSGPYGTLHGVELNTQWIELLTTKKIRE